MAKPNSTYGDFLKAFYQNPALAGSMLNDFSKLQNDDYRRALRDFYNQQAIKLSVEYEEAEEWQNQKEYGQTDSKA